VLLFTSRRPQTVGRIGGSGLKDWRQRASEIGAENQGNGGNRSHDFSRRQGDQKEHDCHAAVRSKGQDRRKQDIKDRLAGQGRQQLAQDRSGADRFDGDDEQMQR
jgi:hypothetical protein